MRKQAVTAVIIFLLLLFLPARYAVASYVQGEILVRFKPGVSTETIHQVHTKLQSQKKAVLSSSGIQRIRVAQDLSVDEAVALYQSEEDVLYAEPNYIRRTFVVPNDPQFSDQWGLHNTGQLISTTSGTPGADIRASEAWGIVREAPEVILVLIDSGVDYTHPDLDGNIWNNPGEVPFDGNDDDGNGYIDDVRGWNFIGTQDSDACPSTCECVVDDPVGNNDPMDDFGHGTHVAGIMGAEGNNGEGIAGVLWNTQIMPLKIIDGNGCGTIADEIQAIHYAIEKLRVIQSDPSQQNVRMVINASFGGPASSQFELEAISDAEDAGIVFVAAAGNDGTNNDASPIFPANYDLSNVITVAASDANDRLAAFSNFGQDTVDLTAPGDCIKSTTPLGSFTLAEEVSCPGAPITPQYAFLSGTSMAVPHVTGVVGLLLAQDSTLLPSRIKAIILLMVDPKDALDGRVASSGRLSARKVLLRQSGSTLSGGDGGCGGLFGYLSQDSTPPGTAIGFITVLFLPLLIPLLRRWRSAFLGRRFMLGLLSPVFILLGSGVTDAEEWPGHAVAVKMGYHFYPDSEYFETNASFLNRDDFSGISGELEYSYRFRDRFSGALSLGYYDGKSDTDKICCADVRFQTGYFLITPRYHFPLSGRRTIGRDFERRGVPMDVYVGSGIGVYHFNLKQSGEVSDTLSTTVMGVHLVLGMKWAVTQNFAVLMEGRYAFATVESANLIDDALGIGGLNFSIGVAYHFTPIHSVP